MKSQEPHQKQLPESGRGPLLTTPDSSWKPDIAEVFADGDAIDRAMQIGISKARQAHKRAGHPVAEWRDGRVVWVPADEIESDAELLRLQEIGRRTRELRRVFSILEERARAAQGAQ
ncbi:MAG: hypothetical protein AAB074_22210 [Planctomycetota bacterium]